ncbi:adhesion G-protein coupled receptor V1 isoform X2 [Carassius carassius]|uniref:adhesion G-protein coupled receptor V1 isoform X2 n=1 Tax=Carassius carassius TaxID=217509 RepID=UPI002868DB55|nr:adhesion G-protein coupled receptor V1 isoform X2 [Carassius carassius]
MQELQKAEFFGPTLIWPAVAVQDFVMAEGTLTLETGEKSAGLDMALTPNSGSSNPTPNGSAWLSLMPLKVFSVSLHGRASKPLADGQGVVYRIHNS